MDGPLGVSLINHRSHFQLFLEMRTILILLAFVAVAIHSQDVPLEEAMLKFFEQFRCRMLYEQENIGVPRLEPMEEEEMEFEFDMEGMGAGKLLLKNVRVEGLAAFNVSLLEMQFQTLDMLMQIELPELKVTGWYSISGEMPIYNEFVDLKGSGDFEFLIEGMRLKMDGKMGHEGFTHTWWMERMAFEFGIEKLSGFMKGIMDDDVLEDFFTFLINNSGPDLIEAVFPEIEPEIVEYAKEMMPELLNGTPLLQVINIIYQDVEFLMELPEGEECPMGEK